MKALFLWVYFLIVGCFIGGFYFIGYLSGDVYREEFRKGYVDYAQRIAPFIISELLVTENQQQTLDYWMSIVGDELSGLNVISVSKNKIQPGEKIAVSELSVTEFSDEIRLLVPLPALHDMSNSDTTPALEFYFVDAYSDAIEAWYLSGVFAVYVFMAGVIGLLVFVLYRYLQSIKSLTTAVISGDLKARMKNNHIPVFHALSQDINQMAQELENKHQESEIFLGAIHHELRSPLTKLRLALDMALAAHNGESSEQETAFQRELMIDMDTDLEELNALMEDILMLSRLRLQNAELEMQNFNALEVVNKISSAINDSRLIVPSSSAVTIFASQVFLERALSNIITNALKFARSAVHVGVFSTKNQVQIAVSDDGPGIPESEQKLIFKPFYRVDKGRARITGGVGLGLAIARLVISKMGGEIEVKGSASGGACFIISLPKSRH